MEINPNLWRWYFKRVDANTIGKTVSNASFDRLSMHTKTSSYLLMNQGLAYKCIPSALELAMSWHSSAALITFSIM